MQVPVVACRIMTLSPSPVGTRIHLVSHAPGRTFELNSPSPRRHAPSELTIWYVPGRTGTDGAADAGAARATEMAAASTAEAEARRIRTRNPFLVATLRHR